MEILGAFVALVLISLGGLVFILFDVVNAVVGFAVGLLLVRRSWWAAALFAGTFAIKSAEQVRLAFQHDPAANWRSYVAGQFASLAVWTLIGFLVIRRRLKGQEKPVAAPIVE